ncbi:hypothetical protein QQF73_11610 [Marinobacter sp. M216]|uniref:RiboL-PSP-HEPN domain-containing protein n=1 Tax=Marinobacter albus TaxID=3030833 RepID=A0ABT7HD23_9GAMM|nr:hypothetical protein [Marinobacter sp. M216]MDK9558268.1 hypothetical protein [Marinobacter sp. M216]
MSVSDMSFERWTSRESSTWTFQVFQKYNRELSRMYISHIAANEFIYRNLGKNAQWEDPVSKHFKFRDETHEHTFGSIKGWSDSFNDFDNWTNLNSVMAMSSNLETYLSTVIKLALESDVGVLFGAKRRIDGIEIIKHGRSQPFDFEDKIVSCTKGEWGSRVNAFKKIFGQAPEVLESNISRLEKLRKLRNNVGHAFGRDIELSRSHNVIDAMDMHKLKREKTLEYQKLIYGIARAIDKQLLNDHIGEYQTLYFYHNLRPSLKHDDSNHQRKVGNHMAILKKKLGQFGAAKAGKKFCRELIVYYEAL